MPRWWSAPYESGVIYVDGVVDPVPRARARIERMLRYLEEYGHALNQDGLRLARRVIWAEVRVLRRAGLGEEARAMLAGRTVLARLGPRRQR